MSGVKTLIIHSGTFKTGSSAIQLYLNRAEHHGLLASAGARYPQTGRTTGIQHANLVAELRGQRVFMPDRGGWQRLLKEINAGDADTTIVSSESFSTLRANELEHIGTLCRSAGVRVRWIHYVREQAGFHNAFYVERIVTMRPDLRDVLDLPFEEFATWSPIDLGFLQYATFVDQLRAAIPDVDLCLRPFSRPQLVDGDVVADFCAALGLPFEQEHGGTTNIGTGWRTVETARRLVPHIHAARLGRRVRRAPNPTAARQRWLQLIRSELVQASAEVGWNVESASYMTAAHHEKLLAEYRQENARLAAMTPFPWLDIVESTPMKLYNVGTFDDIPGEELLTVVSRVLTVVHRMPGQVEAMVVQGRTERAVGVVPPPVSLARRAVRATRRRLNR